MGCHKLTYYKNADFLTEKGIKTLTLENTVVKERKYILIMFTDPDGRSASPIFDREGEFLGTDDQGMEGDAIVMKRADFEQGMKHDDAVSKKANINSSGAQKKVDKFMNSEITLPNSVSEAANLISLEATIVGTAADITIYQNLLDNASQGVKVISKVAASTSGVIGAATNGVDTYNDVQKGNYGRATINGTQTAAYATGTAMLFTPAMPLGAGILMVTGATDLIQMGIEYFTGSDY